MSMQTEKKKGKGFSLSKLFFEEEAVEPTVETTSKIPTPTPETLQPPTQNNANVEKFRELLTDSMEEKALNTFDYLKFKKSLTSLKSVIPDEASRFKAAFATAQTLGVTKNTLIETTKHYITVLTEEQTEFEKNAKNQNQNRILDSENKIKEIEATIGEKSEMIKKLTDEISALTSTKTQLSIKVEEDKIRMSQLTNSFSAAWNLLSDEIKADTQKINAYITE